MTTSSFHAPGEQSTFLLPVTKVAEISPVPPEKAWLIKSFWAQQAVGLIGGAPKSCKSWLGLDMAVSVASGTPCLDHFAVQEAGPVLIYLAEDALSAVRDRIDALCQHRGLDIDALPLYSITADVLRLDIPGYQERLRATIEEYKPKLLLLDPLVRLHRIDENRASDVSQLLGFLRELQRAYELAIILVHHSAKKNRSQPGQSLRGSSDLHAFGDSNAYLMFSGSQLRLTLEHRSARPPAPFDVELICADDGAVHLAMSSKPREDQRPLRDRILDLFKTSSQPWKRAEIRAHLCINNQRIGLALTTLEQQGVLKRTSQGWVLVSASGQSGRVIDVEAKEISETVAVQLV